MTTSVSASATPNDQGAGLAPRLFNLSPDIRYVAFHDGAGVTMSSRSDLNNASSSETDLYEELLVNPALLEIASRRGRIDCGGLDFLIVGYGNFLQFVAPLNKGHISIAFERASDPITAVSGIRSILADFRRD